MSENSRTVAAVAIGAVAGAVAGYLFFTDRGRAWRRQLEPALEDLSRELSHFRGTVNKAAGVATEGWRLLNEAIGDRDTHFGTSRQSSPF